mmetsp:Transcript_37532/g.87583  ORF Transcript_37532/g.87583 Transcript_37532/m.87583 type:complete len:266 (-) Transcript_37532:75-872(-)
MAQRHVPQRGGSEKAAVLGPVLQVGAQRAAQAEVEECGVLVDRQCRVARHGQRDMPEVGEHRKAHAGLLVRGRVAAGAVAFLHVVEDRHAALLGGCERGLVSQIGVEFAAERVEVGAGLFEVLQRDRQPQHRGVRVVEHVLAGRRDRLRECLRIGRAGEPGGNLGFAGVGHFIGVHQGHQGLVVAGVDAAVPGPAAGRSLVFFASRGFHFVEMLCEGDGSVQIPQRRRVAKPQPVHRRPTELHQQPVRRPERGLGVMAAGAGLLA